MFAIYRVFIIFIKTSILKNTSHSLIEAVPHEQFCIKKGSLSSSILKKTVPEDK